MLPQKSRSEPASQTVGIGNRLVPPNPADVDHAACSLVNVLTGSRITTVPTRGRPKVVTEVKPARERRAAGG
jgi:hypothetical protein